jgi:hypothetical protein
MLKGDPCIENSDLDTFSFSFTPEGGNAEKLYTPIDRFGRGQ